ncbi:ribosomal protein L7/L12 [Novosphingobium malaysiense]|uniref:Large ribosomal subunit protein bL12 C-terminal domain-containing protein n=1 Tax=Novosphingobium malaysiense TaxID=1348853 RepID=A0A0B1ZJC1_9SPHN|nr:ribosomal protein L7/L12 [Novosphingobium malaysiense]KHK89398.1 hypothetical protein LK12_19895 [Novosphingobium malaysiense]
MSGLDWLLFMLMLLVVFALGWMAGRGTARRRGASAPLPPAYFDLGPALRAEIETAVAEGHKIDAIKLLREATGMGLKESKDAVEAMERDRL